MQKIKKQEQEKQAVTKMIEIYCHKQHRQKKLCEECAKLKEYAYHRIDICPFMETKSFCNNCKVHCYQKEMRDQIRKVMRFSGPRMLLHDPIMAIRHVIAEKKERKQL